MITEAVDWKVIHSREYEGRVILSQRIQLVLFLLISFASASFFSTLLTRPTFPVILRWSGIPIMILLGLGMGRIQKYMALVMFYYVDYGSANFDRKAYPDNQRDTVIFNGINFHKNLDLRICLLIQAAVYACMALKPSVAVLSSGFLTGFFMHNSSGLGLTSCILMIIASAIIFHRWILWTIEGIRTFIQLKALSR